jgi:hypothetical protein
MKATFYTLFYTVYAGFYTLLYLKIKTHKQAHSAFHLCPQKVVNRKQACSYLYLSPAVAFSAKEGTLVQKIFAFSAVFAFKNT